MSWFFSILGVLAAIAYGMYQLGPGMNKRRGKKKNEAWIKKWKELSK
ncbi:MAG TPA: hypothetical protein VK907_12505 [Phnomibacter sp.]|nr:hypothetical protein [Phnomibacter sp.]